jgi:hypothetical protein
MTNRFLRPQDHPADVIQHPLNGFDQAAYDAFYSGRKELKLAILDAERRDGVAWTRRGPQGNNIPLSVLRAITPSVGNKVFWIKINGLESVRITGDPISFLANKKDHYIPEDCPIEFTPISLT